VGEGGGLREAGYTCNTSSRHQWSSDTISRNTGHPSYTGAPKGKALLTLVSPVEGRLPLPHVEQSVFVFGFRLWFLRWLLINCYICLRSVKRFFPAYVARPLTSSEEGLFPLSLHAIQPTFNVGSAVLRAETISRGWIQRLLSSAMISLLISSPSTFQVGRKSRSAAGWTHALTSRCSSRIPSRHIHACSTGHRHALTVFYSCLGPSTRGQAHP